MRVGISVSGRRPVDEVVRLAAATERCGLDEVWITEDYLERGACTVAAAVAATTRRVTVGIGTVNPWTRHPALLAMEIATLDELAAGRAVLGLGASNKVWMQDQLGIPFERPLDRLREAVVLVRALIAGGRVDHDGDEFAVHASLSFAPTRQRLPVVLGVKGRRALALADDVADGVLLSVLSSAAYVRWVRSRLRRPLPLSAYVVFACDDDAAAARDRVRPTVAAYLGLHGDHDITRSAGLDPQLASRFREGWLARTPRVDLVDDELLRRFAVAGTPDDCIAGFTDLAAAGVDSLVVRDDGVTEVDELVAAAARCARVTR